MESVSGVRFDQNDPEWFHLLYVRDGVARRVRLSKAKVVEAALVLAAFGVAIDEEVWHVVEHW